ncbi:MAG: hypothetical protein ABI723_09460 [Bacteroidia bacterium]
MKSLKSVISIILMASTSLLASSDYKMVKSEMINGKPVPVVTLKAVEVSAIKKDVKLTGSAIADETFAKSKSNLVKSILFKGKIMPFVSLRTVEVSASRKEETTDINNSIDDEMANTNLVKTTVFKGELMPSVELNTVQVIAARTEQNTVSKMSLKVYSLVATMFTRIRIK